MNLSEKETQIAQLVVDYIKNNPKAMHSPEGIARWWILNQRFEEEIASIEKIINYLISIGILQKKSIPDGQNDYIIQLKSDDSVVS